MKNAKNAPAARVDRPRLTKVPQEPDMLVYAARSAVALIIRALLRAYCRFEVIGQEHLRSNRSFVLVANHSSHLDTVCLLSALPLRRLHRTFPAAAADYFFTSVPRMWFATVFMNALPFARQTHARHSLAICAQLLATPGNVLIIFPEGTRSPTGALQEFKGGIGTLLAGRDVNVLPCYVDGAARAWPKGKRLPRPRKVRLIIGAAHNFGSTAAEKETASNVTAELHAAVADLARRYGGH